MSIISSLSPRAVAAPESGIVEVINYARGREGLIPLWAGEGDLPSPDFINRATTESLAAGETFYTWQRGIPELRQALSDYYARHFSVSLPVEHFYVTGSGMHAIMLAVQAVASPGDEIIYLSPTWPNIISAIDISGAHSVGLPLDFVGGRWALDLAKLEAAITPKTKGLFINTPANPTGWTASLEDLKAILALARKHGIWIIADEIYARYYYAGAARAPSFLDVMEEGDRIIFANSFSKNWSMTGWRVGWLIVPQRMVRTIERLQQNLSISVPALSQIAAQAAFDGAAEMEAIKHGYQENRQILIEGLPKAGLSKFLPADGAFYLYADVSDFTSDSFEFAKQMLEQARVAATPGLDFDPVHGRSFIRFSYARSPGEMREAVDRIAHWLK